MDVIQHAIAHGERTLSEYDAKLLLAAYGIPVVREKQVLSVPEAILVAQEIGYPVVLKAVAAQITHKSELHLVELNLRSEEEVRSAGERLLRHVGGSTALLVQQMVTGQRELLLGLIRDIQFGPCVLFGLGGIFAEVLEDVALRVAPFDIYEARRMIDETKAARLLQSYRGMEAVNLDLLSRILVTLGTIGLEHPEVKEIDINPIIIAENQPVAVDALVVLEHCDVV